MFKDNKEDIKRAAEDAKEKEKEKQKNNTEEKSGDDKTKEDIQESFEQ